MTWEEFKFSLQGTAPPSSLSPLLQSLWHDARGDWNGAHELAQDVHTPEGSWVHAYLHRKEGDLSNASYWYQRAKKQVPTGSLNEEWEHIVRELI